MNPSIIWIHSKYLGHFFFSIGKALSRIRKMIWEKLLLSRFRKFNQSKEKKLIKKWQLNLNKKSKRESGVLVGTKRKMTIFKIFSLFFLTNTHTQEIHCIIVIIIVIHHFKQQQQQQKSSQLLCHITRCHRICKSFFLFFSLCCHLEMVVVIRLMLFFSFKCLC